jgi:phage tail tube protein FII
MSSEDAKSLPPDEVLHHLQETLLRAALTQQPLPHNERPLNFPDLAFILRHPNIFLSGENLFGAIVVEGLPKPLRILSTEELAQEAVREGDIAYLRFQPPQATGERSISLTLEGRIATQDTQQRVMGLSGVQVKFTEDGGEWKADEPVMFAM